MSAHNDLAQSKSKNDMNTSSHDPGIHSSPAFNTRHRYQNSNSTNPTLSVDNKDEKLDHVLSKLKCSNNNNKRLFRELSHEKYKNWKLEQKLLESNCQNKIKRLKQQLESQDKRLNFQLSVIADLELKLNSQNREIDFLKSEIENNKRHNSVDNENLVVHCNKNEEIDDDDGKSIGY